MDKAPQHTSNDVVKYLRENIATLRFIYLPTATPELSAIEEYWRQTKRDVLVSEFYATFVEMHRTLSEYMRTAPVSLNVMAYINRRSLLVKDF